MKFDLSFALTNTYVNQLLEKGWLVTSSKSSGHRGRKSGCLRVEGSRARILCVFSNLNEISARLFNFEGKVLFEREKKLEPLAAQPEYLNMLVESVSGLLTQCGEDVPSPVPVICLDGAVIREYGMALHLNGLPAWNPVSLQNYFHSRLNLDPLFMSQSHALLHHLRVSSGERDFLYLQLFPCLTFGAIENGEITRGSIGTAGPLSHLGLNPEGKPCACGQRGCLETMADFRERWEALRDKVLPGLVSRHNAKIVFINPSERFREEPAALKEEGVRFIVPSTEDVLRGAMHAGAREIILESL